MARITPVTAEEYGFVCRVCGAPLQDEEPLGGRCLACAQDGAFDDEEELQASPGPFEHYRLATRADGTPVELGRGAMGITYKAFDINLHCPVALKVINEKYLGDESARLRLSREARAAASIRHAECRLGIPPGSSDRKLLLCDGVRGGRNSREPYQTLRPAQSEVFVGNCGASWRGSRCGAQEEPCPSGY